MWTHNLHTRLFAAKELRKIGKPEERKDQLLAFYSQYLAQNLDDAGVLKERARLHLDLGGYKDAIDDLDILIDQDQKDELSLGLRGNAFRLLGSRNMIKRRQFMTR